MSTAARFTPKRPSCLTIVLLTIILVLSLAVFVLVQERTTIDLELRKYTCAIEMAEGGDLWENCVYGSARDR